jgi:hypothetical protein
MHGRDLQEKYTSVIYATSFWYMHGLVNMEIGRLEAVLSDKNRTGFFNMYNLSHRSCKCWAGTMSVVIGQSSSKVVKSEKVIVRTVVPGG